MVMVGAAAVVAVLEWRRMRGVGVALDVSDGQCQVGSDVLDVGGQQMWSQGSGRCGGVEAGLGVSDVEVQVWQM